jgi:hypothetical protein
MPLPRAQRPQHALQQQQLQQQQKELGPVQALSHPDSTPVQQSAQRQQQQQQQQQQQRETPSQLSFVVEAGTSDGRKVLQVLAALLSSLCRAQEVHVDSSRWVIRCKLPLEGSNGSSSSAGGGDVVQVGTPNSSGVLQVELSMYRQRQGLQVVCKVVGSTGPQSSSRLAAAVEQVRADMALMWNVSDA